MKHKILFSAILTALVLSTFPVKAQSLVEPDYTPHDPLATTPWYIGVSPGQKQADLAFIKGMRPHHAGALTMSEEYLADPEASNTMMKQLAKGIIHNQEFEIAVLDRVETYLKELDLSGSDQGLGKIADQGLAQNKRFVRAPMPGILDLAAGNDETSVADVKFAKAMIVHHEAALTMCRNYIDKPHATNGYLGRMCLDILRDQAQEIAFMHEQMNKYPGDVAQIALDPSMIDGMDDMMHDMDMHQHH